MPRPPAWSSGGRARPEFHGPSRRCSQRACRRPRRPLTSTAARTSVAGGTVSAADADEEEDGRGGDERDDERESAGDADGEPAEPHEEEEHERPDERMNSLVDARGRRCIRRDPTDTGPKKFTEPVALSSTRPADRPLPRRACELSFNLVALRARCTREPRGHVSNGQASPSPDCRYLRLISSASRDARPSARPRLAGGAVTGQAFGTRAASTRGRDGARRRQLVVFTFSELRLLAVPNPQNHAKPF